MEEFQNQNIISSLGNIMNSPGTLSASTGVGSSNEFEQFFQNLLFEKLDEVMGKKILETSDGRTVNPREVMEQYKTTKIDGNLQGGPIQDDSGVLILPHSLLITSDSARGENSHAFLTSNKPRSKSLPCVLNEREMSMDQFSGYNPKRRNSHLESEKRRRIYMKESYDKLASMLPPGQFRRHSKANILNGTCDYLVTLKTKCQQLETIIENLKCSPLHSN